MILQNMNAILLYFSLMLLTCKKKLERGIRVCQWSTNVEMNRNVRMRMSFTISSMKFTIWIYSIGMFIVRTR